MRNDPRLSAKSRKEQGWAAAYDVGGSPANAQRATAFLVKIKAITMPSDGLASLLNEADQSTIAVSTKTSAASVKAAAPAAKSTATKSSQGDDNTGKHDGGGPTSGTQSGPKK